MHATRPHIGRMHPGARGTLIKHHQFFALFKAPERRRQGTDIHGLRRDIQQMRQKPPDFRKQDPDQLRPPWHGNPQKFLNRKRVSMLLIHRRDIIEPVKIRHRLQIRLRLDQLLRAAMKQSDMRINALDDLAIKLQHKTQHAMGRRMLRSEIDTEITKLMLGHEMDSSE